MITWLPQLDSSIVLDGFKSLLLLLSVLIARALVVRSIARNAAMTPTSQTASQETVTRPS